MGRKHVVLTAALLLLTSYILTGCPGSNPAAPINSNNREYGPPFGPISFDDGSGFLATIPSDVLTEDPLFVKGIGLNGAISDMAYGFLVRPTSTPGDADFAVFDLETEMLHVIDSEGSITSSFFDGDAATENMFAFSNGGARLAYVREINNQQQLILSGVTSSDLYEIASLSGSRRFFGRPMADITFNITNIAMMTDDGTNDTRIEVYNLDGISHQLNTPVKALTYSNDGDYLAWIDESSQPKLVVFNASLTIERARREFNTYGVGASALTWSPNDNMIAFFAESVGKTGRLLIYDLGQDIFSEIMFSGTYVFPEDSDELWAQPSWNEYSSELAFVVLSNEGSYNVIKVDLQGNMTVLYEDVGGTRYVEWMK